MPSALAGVPMSAGNPSDVGFIMFQFEKLPQKLSS
jgi:hypothetical protein